MIYGQLKVSYNTNRTKCFIGHDPGDTGTLERVSISKDYYELRCISASAVAAAKIEILCEVDALYF